MQAGGKHACRVCCALAYAPARSPSVSSPSWPLPLGTTWGGVCRRHCDSGGGDERGGISPTSPLFRIEQKRCACVIRSQAISPAGARPLTPGFNVHRTSDVRVLPSSAVVLLSTHVSLTNPPFETSPHTHTKTASEARVLRAWMGHRKRGQQEQPRRRTMMGRRPRLVLVVVLLLLVVATVQGWRLHLLRQVGGSPLLCMFNGASIDPSMLIIFVSSTQAPWRYGWTRRRAAVVGRLHMTMGAEREGSSHSGSDGEQLHHAVSLPKIPMSSLAPSGEEGEAGDGRGGLDALTRAWESTEAPLGQYTEDDEYVAR